ncbi:MAG: DUF222 domain-containing protein [Frankiaceae bacterium]|nr:DUF222 domain-containing protein [Frankiaceae bacterium]
MTRSSPETSPRRRRRDPDQLAHFVRHQIATWCEPALDADEESAEQARFFSMRNKHNGRWRGTFDVPDAIAEMIQTVIEPLARQDGDADRRPAGQRRLDALADVFGLVLRYADLPEAGGARPRLTYVVPASWAVRLPTPAQRALGTDALPSAGFFVDLEQHPGQGCASAPWTGPATRTLIETLRCDAQVDRVVLDEAGQVVSLISVSEQITAGQRRAVAARDRCCVAKGMQPTTRVLRRASPASPRGRWLDRRRQPRAALPQTSRDVASRAADHQ